MRAWKGVFLTTNETECVMMCFTLKSKLQRLTASLSSFSLRFRFCGETDRQDETLFTNSWSLMHFFGEL